MYLVQDGSHIDTVCKTLADVAWEMAIRFDYFTNGMPDVYFTPESQKTNKGFTFYALTDDSTPDLQKQYFCTYTKIHTLDGLSAETLIMSDL
jgi:hypothetical protein